MSFYTEAILTPRAGGWVLASPLKWEVGRKGSGLFFEVQSGFVSDLASIPGWARWWLNPGDPQFAKAAILHDAMLAAGFAPSTAAAEFYEALKADGVGGFKAAVMGLAVLLYTTAKRIKAD